MHGILLSNLDKCLRNQVFSNTVEVYVRLDLIGFSRYRLKLVVGLSQLRAHSEEEIQLLTLHNEFFLSVGAHEVFIGMPFAVALSCHI